MAKANVVNTLVIPAETKVYPYYDDFNEDKNFKRILFRPGYAVQARELTQIQTILQNQIERFGQHIFENGSPVIGGDIVWNKNSYVYSLNLQSTYAGTDIDPTVFKNRTVVLASANTENTFRFQVVQATPATETDPPALFGNFLLGDMDSVSGGETIKTKIDTNNNDVIYANLATSNVTSHVSSIAFLKDSIFFFNGFFVKVPSQVVVVDKYGNQDDLNISIGLEFDDSIVTEISDASLLDPAQESFNYQAPGAARYKTDLVLTTRSLDSVDKSKYIELARIENGILRKLVKYPMYSEIEEVMARRTFDESGNYTVRPFVLNMEDDKVDPVNYVSARLSQGKAYVYGYEFETIAPTDIRVPRALSKANVTNYTLNLNYGNYVIVDGLNGVFDTARMQQVDIHCVPTTSVNPGSATSYAQTHIGLARVRDVNFYSGDTDVTTRKYEMYIFDTQFKSITGNAAVIGTPTNNVSFYNISSLSVVTDAYKNATLRVVSGPGAGYKYDISSYGSNGKIYISTNFMEAIANTSNLAIEFDFSDAESFIVSTTRTAGAPTYNANANITILNKSNGMANGDAFITESSLDTLVFPLPEKYVANGIYNEAYQYRRRFDGVVFTSGNSAGSPIVAISSGGNPLEDFVGGTTTSNIASTVMDNFYVVATSGSRAVGEVIKVSSTVYGSPETVFFNTGNSSDSFTATVFAKMQYAANVASKIKNLVLANTKTFATESSTDIASGPTGSSANVYVTTGQVVINNPTKKVGVSESLYLTDVISVAKIWDLAGASLPAAGADLTRYTDVTDRYEFDNGQKASFYDHASIKLKPGYMTCVGPLVVCCRYYTHSQPTNAGGFFTIDSYPELANTVYEEGTSIGTGYTLVPSFKNVDGSSYSLRDCIDFRPTRQNATNTYSQFAYNLNSYSVASITPPLAATDFDLGYQYYIGRRDLIVLKADRSFARIEGIPDKYPQDPPVPAKSMVLYALTVAPYTQYPSNVNVRYIENKRYTMRDIGKIEKRVESLEYYVTLNNLEQSAVNQPIRDVDGLDRTKYGIFADTFVGHSLGNSNLDDYQCAMNFQVGWLQPKSKQLGFTLKANTAASSGVTFYRDKVLLNNEEVVWISQDLASKWAPVAEYMFASFKGKIFCLPEADIWKSVTKKPDLVVVDEVNNEHVNFDVVEAQMSSAATAIAANTTPAVPLGTVYDSIVDSGSRNPSSGALTNGGKTTLPSLGQNSPSNRKTDSSTNGVTTGSKSGTAKTRRFIVE